MPTAAVLDTGASYSIIIQSLARRAGVREIPGATGFGRGLHNREIPLTYGVLDGLAFAGYRLKNVPVLVMPDDALLFETRRGRLSLPMVLGLHLLKEFAITIEYEPAQVTFARADAGGSKVDPMQNLFYFRGRIFARTSVNLTDPALFLFDTGSEGTLMTSAGLSRLRLSRSLKLYPQPLSGIGQSRVEWGRLRRVSIGVDDSLLSFRDLAVREDDSAFEDGILGASAMKPFRTRIDFGTMRLVLEEP
jgi:hypothetical protein